jgi:hypothetical protein
VIQQNSNTNTKHNIMKLVFKGIGIIEGIVGLWLLVFVIFLLNGIFKQKMASYGLFFVSILLILTAIYFLYVAYSAFNKSTNLSTKHISITFSIIIAIFLPKVISQLFDINYTRQVEIELRLISLIIAVILYFVTSKIFAAMLINIRHTEDKKKD